MSVFALFFLLVILAGFLRCTKHISSFRKFLKMSRTEQEIEIARADERLQRNYTDYSEDFWLLPLFLAGALLCATYGYWISAVWLAFVFTGCVEKAFRQMILIKIVNQKDRDVLDGFVSEARMAY